MNASVESSVVDAAINCNPENSNPSSGYRLPDDWAVDKDGTEYRCLDRLWAELMEELYPHTPCDIQQFFSTNDNLKNFSCAIDRTEYEPRKALTFILKNWAPITELIRRAEGMLSVPAYPYAEYLMTYFKQLYLILITSDERLA